MKDKKEHLVAGLLIAALVGLPCYLDSGNLFAGLWAAVFATAIAGGVKELADNVYGIGADWKDFAATCIGMAVVVLFILGLHFGKG